MSSGTPHPNCINTLKTFRDLTRKNDSPLTGREYQVLMTLISYRNSVMFQCNPEIRRVADDMNCSKSTVQTAIKTLENKGFIRITGMRYERGARANNQYWIMHDIDIVLKAYHEEESSDYLMCYHDGMYDKIEDYILTYEKK